MNKYNVVLKRLEQELIKIDNNLKKELNNIIWFNRNNSTYLKKENHIKKNQETYEIEFNKFLMILIQENGDRLEYFLTILDKENINLIDDDLSIVITKEDMFILEYFYFYLTKAGYSVIQDDKIIQLR